ncbi:uncharacterized protein KY384_005578 [Bacidia gigantensis]|uniref:uncharacterized protein n=1 Tax=Bacidia gigantensis TaxID=2732470 RepID=UPI001D05060B|nr:uncharacterized protein KY384_005578 [Bacidia gigantensis]KAG8530096.1 hypothetical protein KY384_005578 [Bacidia gigantensis]
MAELAQSAMAFHQLDFQQAPQPTISLQETSLRDQMMTPSRSASPQIKEENSQDEKRSSKKRKSWGQELPTPKTNLPPRKRAKTEDEKEQRRIERVLRNRAAAQSSRERKRQEVEKLEGEKSTIEEQNQNLKDRLMAVEHEKFLLSQKLAKMAAQIKSLKDGTTPPPSEPASPAPEIQSFDQMKIKKEIDDYQYSALTPQTFSSPASMTYSPSESPSQSSLSFDDESLATSPDMTQHPAAMFTPGPIHSSYNNGGVTSNNCDPIIFGESNAQLDDLNFDSLFSNDDSYLQEDQSQAKDAFTVPHLSISGNDFATDFTFDSLVDFEPDHVDQHNGDDFQLGSYDLSGYPDGSAQNVAEVSATQLSIGAST